MRRRREYYIGGRPRRRLGRAAAAALAVIALGGASAMSVYMPALGGAPGATITAGGTSEPGAAIGSSLPSAMEGLPSAAPPVSASLRPSVVPLPSGPPPCAGPPGAALAAVVSHGDIHRKQVALTFDDGTNPENTRQILRILKREHVNATFFPTGRSVERFPDVWRDVAKAKFPIANHTYSHSGLAGKCYGAQRLELERAANVFRTLGIPELPVMRPPYELWDDATSAAAMAENLRAVVLWNIDTRDWQGASQSTIRREALSGGRGSIVLMHTFPEATAAALPGIVRGYRARGFEFVTIGQMLQIDGPVPFPATKG
ncbi:MAG TPA: polysaccharide deacetylase family protein [Candidatus Limnocylindria bacterium]|nr:polysaccharide deacetylase family protein [Candidatus Limnocylindria bacterium]